MVKFYCEVIFNLKAEMKKPAVAGLCDMAGGYACLRTITCVARSP